MSIFHNLRVRMLVHGDDIIRKKVQDSCHFDVMLGLRLKVQFYMSLTMPLTTELNALIIQENEGASNAKDHHI